MKGRKLIQATLDRNNNSGENGLWLGTPTWDAMKLYYPQMGIKDYTPWRGGKMETDFHISLGADMVRISPEFNSANYKHPDGLAIWNCTRDVGKTLPAGIFEECEDIDEIEAFPLWPNPDYMDYTQAIEDAKYAYECGVSVFGSMITDIFTLSSSFFGMQEYFVKMYTDPEIVHAVTRRITDFYLVVNQRFIDLAGQYLTGGFFSMDLGTQQELMIGPKLFDEFLAPYISELISQFKRAGLKFALHSCGAIDKLIPRLIDLGVDILNPLQAKAVGMEPESLARKYSGKLIFCGGVDAQELLPFGSPEQVREEVLRLRDIFKGELIVSPSHDSLLPDVPFENVIALCKAAKE